MKAVENVELVGACDQNILMCFGRAVRGELQEQFEALDHDERIKFIERFGQQVEDNAKRAFELGRQYEQSKSK